MKLSREEILDSEARRREYDAKQKEIADQAKLIRKLDFAEKPLLERIGIYILRGIGILLGLLLVASLVM
jgi:tetrahydromethanopterin S-methyltransferase subunit G